ncbi:F-box/LRR-repeat protein fbxl-1 [Anabrus simplex]|uniref:F-box/LRR-repeat protein fbxl-1 n=1 Tax=Anabrus simplex TaxID=316456 RepID=UPI0035A30099
MEAPAIAETLPTEILERIFSYSTHEDVVLSIQNVCSRWRQVAQNSCLWEHLEYSPDRSMSWKKIVEILKISPKLQKLIIKQGDDSVLQAITDNCAELRKLELNWDRYLGVNFIEDLREKCQKIEYLHIGNKVLENSRMCKAVGNFTNLKVLIVNGLHARRVPINIKPIAGCMKLEHFEFQAYDFKMKDLHYLLFMRKDTLHTLGVCCCSKSGECVLPAVATCKLKSLTLFDYWECRKNEEKIKYFGHLKTVRALTIEGLCDKTSDRIEKIFENGNMSQLRDLRLYVSRYFDDCITDVVSSNCPLLQTLTLDNCREMSDASLKNFHNFKELNSLTISGMNAVTNAGIFHLQDLHNLNCLGIADCRLSKQGYESMLGLSTLRELRLWRQDLAEFPWNLIPRQMKYLRCLGIYNCRNVDMCAIEKLKRLPALNVSYQEMEDMEDMDMFLKRRFMGSVIFETS